MYGMFLGDVVQRGHLAWDMSSVTNMERMFEGATSFNTNISAWDTSSVTTWVHVSWCVSVQRRHLGWDTRSVTNMQLMFEGASAFNADISAWNTIDEHAASVSLCDSVQRRHLRGTRAP